MEQKIIVQFPTFKAPKPKIATRNQTEDIKANAWNWTTVKKRWMRFLQGRIDLFDDFESSTIWRKISLKHTVLCSQDDHSIHVRFSPTISELQRWSFYRSFTATPDCTKYIFVAFYTRFPRIRRMTMDLGSVRMGRVLWREQCLEMNFLKEWNRHLIPKNGLISVTLFVNRIYSVIDVSKGITDSIMLFCGQVILNVMSKFLLMIFE
jgi:hypothetical protein